MVDAFDLVFYMIDAFGVNRIQNLILSVLKIPVVPLYDEKADVGEISGDFAIRSADDRFYGVVGEYR